MRSSNSNMEHICLVSAVRLLSCVEKACAASAAAFTVASCSARAVNSSLAWVHNSPPSWAWGNLVRELRRSLADCSSGGRCAGAGRSKFAPNMSQSFSSVGASSPLLDA